MDAQPFYWVRLSDRIEIVQSTIATPDELVLHSIAASSF